ncbi:hypothetical protein IWX90DRAFT_443667 [Phyllosticta citrichinensis]|uniref:Uncharacterized protein n=1 Tax=Phyllosticta citrichinensis TaxID=1130410 RepID=A0ABR1XGY1_9PEZI
MTMTERPQNRRLWRFWRRGLRQRRILLLQHGECVICLYFCFCRRRRWRIFVQFSALSLLLALTLTTARRPREPALPLPLSLLSQFLSLRGLNQTRRTIALVLSLSVSLALSLSLSVLLTPLPTTTPTLAKAAAQRTTNARRDDAVDVDDEFEDANQARDEDCQGREHHCVRRWRSFVGWLGAGVVLWDGAVMMRDWKGSEGFGGRDRRDGWIGLDVIYTPSLPPPRESMMRAPDYTCRLSSHALARGLLSPHTHHASRTTRSRAHKDRRRRGTASQTRREEKLDVRVSQITSKRERERERESVCVCVRESSAGQRHEARSRLSSKESDMIIEHDESPGAGYCGGGGRGVCVRPKRREREKRK